MVLSVLIVAPYITSYLCMLLSILLSIKTFVRLGKVVYLKLQGFVVNNYFDCILVLFL